MDVNSLKAVYFIGAGGIGMSALVRYFLSKGMKVGGYDRTPSDLTQKLIEEGNDEELNLLQEEIVTKAEDLVALDTSFLFTDIQRSEYINRGGAPFLDGKYTVFGEVVEGMDVVERISQVSVNDSDEPLEEVKIIKIKVEK